MSRSVAVWDRSFRIQAVLANACCRLPHWRDFWSLQAGMVREQSHEIAWFFAMYFEKNNSKE